MKLKGIKHIFFDLDHTLWDFERNSALAFSHIFKKRNLPVTLEEFIKVYSPINFECWRLYRNNEISKEALRHLRLERTFKAMQIDVSTTTINQLSDDYIEHLPDNNYLFDNAVEVLGDLKLNYKLHIITNGFNEVQYVKLRNSNILHFFDAIVTSEQVGVKKPNPKIFNYALEQANASAVESVMIGDSLEADIQGAQNVGMRAIYCDFINNPVEVKSTRINNLRELLKFL